MADLYTDNSNDRALVRSALGIPRNYRLASEFGIVGDGVADDSTALENALNSIASSGDVLIMERDAVFKMSRGIVMSINANVQWNGSTIDFSALVNLTGNAITARQTRTDNRIGRMSGLKIKGPVKGSASTATMLFCGAANGTGDVRDWHPVEFEITGGAVGMGFGDRTYLLSFNNFIVHKQYNKCVDLTMGSTSGENIRFIDCVIADARNGTAPTTGTAVAVYSSYVSGKSLCEVYFTNCSIDYSDICLDLRAGRIGFAGGHIETDGNNPICAINAVASMVSVTMTDVQIYQPGASAGNAYPETSGGRPVLFTLDGGWAELYLNSVQWLSMDTTNGNANTKLVTRTAQQRISVTGLSLGRGSSSGTSGKLCSMGDISPIGIAGTFTNTLTGWRDDSEVNFIRNSAFASQVAGSTINVTSITSATTTATATTASAHGYAVNDWVPMSGQSPAAFSGTYGFVKVLTVPNSTSFTYTIADQSNASASTPGTILTKGTNPSWFTAVNLNGLTLINLGVDTSSGKPICRLRLIGQATASQGSTIYFDGQGASSPISTKQYDLWRLQVQARVVAVNGSLLQKSLFLQAIERQSGGTSNGGGSATSAMKFWFDSYKYDFSIATGSTAYVQPVFGLANLTANEYIDQTIELMAPELVLQAITPTHGLATLGNTASSALPSGRYGIDTGGTNARSGTNALKLTGGVSVDYGPLYSRLAVKAGDWIHVAGWLKTSVGATGSSGIRIEQYDQADNLIRSDAADGSGYISGAQTSYVQHAGIIYARNNTSYIKIRPYTVAFTGDVYFDDIEVTILN